MSGIAGFLNLDGAPASVDAIDAMLQALVRRGPDRQQGTTENAVAFGQALLATTPEARAEIQPWRHPGDGCLVVSDSRLDNRPELLRELGIEGTADDIGDARLLHAAWRRWGDDCADRLLGDFAFAIWDPRAQSLFCARDIAGVRPFYYCHRPGKLFAFASQPDALLALPDVPRDFDEGRMVDALVPLLQGYDNTSTFFSAIRRLPPAHVLVLDSGQLRLRQYWTPVSSRPANLPDSEQGWIDGLRDLLRESVRCRLRGNVRVGSMLSGGLDSSALVAFASEALAAQGRGRLATFSAVSSLTDCPETRAIRSMLATFDLDATCLDWQQVPGLMDRLARDWPQMGEPFDGNMALVECQYITAAEKGVRVMFDGIDADTLFEEGDFLTAQFLRGRWWRVFREARGQARFYGMDFSTLGFITPILKQVFMGERLRGVVRKLRAPGLHRRLVAEALVDPSFAKAVDLAGRMQRVLKTRASQPLVSADGQGRSWMASTYTTAGLERYGRLAAAHGIEPRHPYMDRRVLEYCAWLPASLRLKDGWPKWALRAATADVLPADVAWRRGKEHLGWRFSRELFLRLGRFHPVLAQKVASRHSAGIDPTALPLLEEADGSTIRLPDDWEARMTAAALVVWRYRVAGSGL